VHRRLLRPRREIRRHPWHMALAVLPRPAGRAARAVQGALCGHGAQSGKGISFVGCIWKLKMWPAARNFRAVQDIFSQEYW